MTGEVASDPMTAMPITATMLYDFVRCPHRVTMDLFGNPADRDPVSPFVQLLWDRGHAFEHAVVEGRKERGFSKNILTKWH